MTTEEIERVLLVARTAYQVETRDDGSHLVDASQMELLICPPGCSGPDDVHRPDLWSIGLGEQGTQQMVVVTGATLHEAFEALRYVVQTQVETVRNLLPDVVSEAP